MTLEDICNLPIAELADSNCILFLWVVDTQLFDAGEVIKAWGFTYKTLGFTWAKEKVTGKDHFGVGMWTRKNPEMCLIATKGKIKRLNAGVRQLQRYKVREHSRKPDEFRSEIVKLVGDLPRIELFARQKVEGWDVWGNEVESAVIHLPVVAMFNDYFGVFAQLLDAVFGESLCCQFHFLLHNFVLFNFTVDVLKDCALGLCLDDMRVDLFGLAETIRPTQRLIEVLK